MDQSTVFGFMLSWAEIIALLEELHEESLPTLRQEALYDYTPNEQAILLEQARRGLVARQFLQPNAPSGQRVLPEVTAAIVASIAPDQAISLLVQDATGGGASTTFYRLGELTISHTADAEGLNAFVVMHEEVALNAVLNDTLGLKGSFERPLAAATNVPTDLLEILFTSGTVPIIAGQTATIASLQQTLEQGATIAILSPYEEEVHSFVPLTLVAGEHAGWVITAPDDNGAVIVPASSAELIMFVRRQLQVT